MFRQKTAVEKVGQLIVSAITFSLTLWVAVTLFGESGWMQHHLTPIIVNAGLVFGVARSGLGIEVWTKDK